MLMNLGLPHQGGVPLKKDSVYSGLLPLGHVMSAPENAHQMLIHPQNLILQATTLFLVTRPRLSYTEKNTRHNIGAVLVAPYLVPYSDCPEDIAATERSYDFNLGWSLEPFVYGEYPKSLSKDGVPLGSDNGNWPKGLEGLMVYIKEKYQNPKIYISENGLPMSRKDNSPLSERLKDSDRIFYIAKHLYSLNNAIK
ncbi:hypothetical protein ACLB2K_048174 [Fragaria x ananassa]